MSNEEIKGSGLEKVSGGKNDFPFGKCRKPGCNNPAAGHELSQSMGFCEECRRHLFDDKDIGHMKAK